MKSNSILTLILFLAISGCHSPAPKSSENGDLQSDSVIYSDAHVPYREWNRTSQCCAASGPRAAISSGGRHSSECGAKVLRAGGNSIDAAVATAFCLAVELPHSTGLAGGGFFLFHSARDEKDYFIDFRETAPRKSSEKMFVAKSTETAPSSIDGGLSVGTPGFVAGFAMIHKRWGKLSWRALLQPSIDLANGGFAVYPTLAQALDKRKAVLEKDSELKNIFFKSDGQPLAAGETLIQKNLARAIDRIASVGANGFYRGPIAKAIAAEVKRKGGLLDERDLRSYRPVYRTPLRGKFDGFEIVTAPPPSAGGMVILQTLGVLLGDKENATRPSSYSEVIHRTAESFKQSYADRAEFIGDPKFTGADAKLRSLLSEKYIARMRASISESARPSTSIRAGQPSAAESPETTHFNVMDEHGNAISSTITINYLFGSAVGVPGYGIILNDEMDDFATQPDRPNVYGLTGSAANSVKANKRPVSSMAPTLLFRQGEPELAIGAPGGSYIPSGITTSLLNYLYLFPGNLKRAVFAPRFHHQWLPDVLFLELDGFPSGTIQKLTAMGYQLAPPQGRARVNVVSRSEGGLTAVFDPRDEGGAEGL